MHSARASDAEFWQIEGKEEKLSHDLKKALEYFRVSHVTGGHWPGCICL